MQERRFLEITETYNLPVFHVVAFCCNTCDKKTKTVK